MEGREANITDVIALKPLLVMALPQVDSAEPFELCADQRAPLFRPVPSVPLHLCPTCNFRLEGLRTRRCPECGNLFSLDAALERGLRQSDACRLVQRQRRFAACMLALSLVIAVAGAVEPCLFFNSHSLVPQFLPKFHSGWLLARGVVLAYLFWSYRDGRWSHARFLLGLLAIVGITVFASG